MQDTPAVPVEPARHAFLFLDLKAVANRVGYRVTFFPGLPEIGCSDLSRREIALRGGQQLPEMIETLVRELAYVSLHACLHDASYRVRGYADRLAGEVLAVLREEPVRPGPPEPPEIAAVRADLLGLLAEVQEQRARRRHLRAKQRKAARHMVRRRAASQPTAARR